MKRLLYILPILAICALALPAHAQYVVKQSTAYTITLPDFIDGSNHIAGLTGQTGTVYLARVTGSSGAVTKAASTNNISEIDSVNSPGQYTLTLTSTETGALGYMKGYYKSAGSDPVSFTVRIVAYNPDDASLLGLTGVGTLSNQTGIKAKTDLIATNAADSPNEQTAQTAAGTAATQATAANGKLLGNIAAQTGDAFARIGANGAGLTALGDTRLGFLTGDAFARIGANGAGLTSLLQASAVPTNFSAMAINGSGQVSLNLTQALDPTNTGDTVGGGIIAARAQGFGKWVISAGHLILYAADGTTVLKNFTITPTPTNATRQ